MKFYVSTYTEGFFKEGPNGSEGIYLCEFDEENRRIRILDSFAFSVNPSFMKLSKDKKNLYVACEKLPPSRIDSYGVKEDGHLEYIDGEVLDVRSCCYLSADKENRFVSVACYGNGEVFTYSIDEQSRFLKMTSCHAQKETGPNKDRQESPHAHSVRLIEALNCYVACDLGCDRISFFDYGFEGNFVKSRIGEIRVPAGYGPRHTTNSRDGRFLYVTCELENRVLSYELKDGRYVLIQDLSSIEEDLEKENTVADIHISNDDHYVFVSNRGLDNIVQYERQTDGSLRKVKAVCTGGKGPRNFALDENVLICANQDSGDVQILEIKNGLLTGEMLGSLKFIAPVCIEKL